MQDLRYYVDVPPGMEKRAVSVEGANKPLLQLLDSINGAFRPGVLTALMGVTGGRFAPARCAPRWDVRVALLGLLSRASAARGVRRLPRGGHETCRMAVHGLLVQLVRRTLSWSRAALQARARPR